MQKRTFLPKLAAAFGEILAWCRPRRRLQIMRERTHASSLALTLKEELTRHMLCVCVESQPSPSLHVVVARKIVLTLILRRASRHRQWSGQALFSSAFACHARTGPRGSCDGHGAVALGVRHITAVVQINRTPLLVIPALLVGRAVGNRLCGPVHRKDIDRGAGMCI